MTQHNVFHLIKFTTILILTGINSLGAMEQPAASAGSALDGAQAVVDAAQATVDVARTAAEGAAAVQEYAHEAKGFFDKTKVGLAFRRAVGPLLGGALCFYGAYEITQKFSGKDEIKIPLVVGGGAFVAGASYMAYGEYRYHKNSTTLGREAAAQIEREKLGNMLKLIVSKEEFEAFKRQIAKDHAEDITRFDQLQGGVAGAAQEVHELRAEAAEQFLHINEQIDALHADVHRENEEIAHIAAETLDQTRDIAREMKK